MSDEKLQNQNAVQKMAGSMRTVFFLSLITNAYDVYRYASTPGDLRQGLSIALGIIGTALIWQLSRELQVGRKQALYCWLAVAMLGYARFIFLDGTFELNALTTVLISLTFGLTMRFVLWMRKGVLS